ERRSSSEVEEGPAVVDIARHDAADDDLILHDHDYTVESLAFEKALLFGDNEGQTGGPGSCGDAECNGSLLSARRPRRNHKKKSYNNNHLGDLDLFHLSSKYACPRGLACSQRLVNLRYSVKHEPHASLRIAPSKI